MTFAHYQIEATTTIAVSFTPQRKMVKDSAGKLYVAYIYNSTDLYLDTSVDGGETWTRNLMASGLVFSPLLETAIAIDSADNVYVVWTETDGTSSDGVYIKQGIYNGTTFTVTTIFVGAGTGEGYWEKLGSPNIFIDLDDHSHICFFRNGYASTPGYYYKVEYVKDGGTEQDIAADGDWNVFAPPSIVVDHSGSVHIVWRAGDATVLRHWQDGTTTTVVTEAEAILPYLSPLIVDADDTVYFLYGAGRDLQLATFASGSWTVSTLYTAGVSYACGGMTITIDAVGNIFVLFNTSGASTSRLCLVRVDGTWSSAATITDAIFTNASLNLMWDLTGRTAEGKPEFTISHDTLNYGVVVVPIIHNIICSFPWLGRFQLSHVTA